LDPEQVWLFPASGRAGNHQAIDYFNETMRQVRLAAGFPQFEYVNLVSYFTDYCRTLGFPTMTIASWTLDRYD
jgi:hypothetical protein